MSFDDRWQTLVAAARRAGQPVGAMPDITTLVQRGMAERTAPIVANNWPGMALAASLCAVCLAGLMTWTPARSEVSDAFAMLAQTPRLLPTTAFIPAPPRPPTLASLSPTDVADRVVGWFTASPENSP